MKIELYEIPVSQVVDRYCDSAEHGVVGYGGQLNIRPAFQREFIYKEKQRDEVIRTIRKNFPLNVMYWVKTEQGDFEVLDGQQRTISICQYVNGDYSLDYQYFHNLTEDERHQILDYKLMIYICEGTDREKLDWFKIINIAGEQLTNQELRNAIYTGPWLTDAKKYFSQTNCPAHQIAGDYMKGSPIRQDYLETVISWLSAKDNMAIEDYMAGHQHDVNANELWLYYSAVMSWVKVTFPKYRKEMKGLNWGLFYNKFGTENYDATAFEAEIIALMEDDDVTKNTGIYEYLLDRDERHLSIRAFTEKQKRVAFEKQKGKCPTCKKVFEITAMEADHITPWHAGGKTIQINCQMLCKDCNRRKSGK